MMKSPLIFIALAAALGAAVTPAQAETHNGPYVGVTAAWDRGEIADRRFARPLCLFPFRQGTSHGGMT